ncbi:c-type cytochrome [uncultured Tateyamaria sp.]|uniref:c-type cytochrome n=1 Tax=uncultured Tateyamaria sp. TaxID=455651 RepID=UPI0026113201|nr:c-type cytochrome [uncultured Tateyamaria sp.]
MVKTRVLIGAVAMWSVAAWAEEAKDDTASASSFETLTVEHEIDADAAEAIFQKSCKACHGNRAQGASSYPALADLEPSYIATQIERYRAGERIGPNSILMISHAKKLSDEDIVNISVYVATAFD